MICVFCAACGAAFTYLILGIAAFHVLGSDSNFTIRLLFPTLFIAGVVAPPAALLWIRRIGRRDGDREQPFNVLLWKKVPPRAGRIRHLEPNSWKWANRRAVLTVCIAVAAVGLVFPLGPESTKSPEASESSKRAESPKGPEALDSLKSAENPKSREASDSPKSVLDLIASGNLHYALREYDNAIADYTEAIRLDPNYADAFYRRGIARQSKGDRAGGEADIKAARTIDPRAAPPESTPDGPPVEIKTGIIRRQAKRNLVAQLKIEADANDYAIKLVDKKTNAEVLMISIAANQTFETMVPLGTYRILSATGPVWYGERLLFGDLTRYFVLHQLGGEDEFQFTFTNNTYHGYDIKLRRVAGGTLSPVPTTPDEFRQR